MYPFLRLAKEMLKFRKAAPLPPFGVHVSHHICWPWDLDPWIELNNGRTLTLYDLGRVPLVMRLGFFRALKQKGWGITVAGNTTRYRRRIKAFERFEMRTRLIGWDKRFFYMEQTMWKGGDCANHLLVRSALVGPEGIVDPSEAAAAMGMPPDSPPLPDWVEAWIKADALRPWPPMA